MIHNESIAAIVTDINKLNALYRVRVDLIEKAQWSQHFHHLSLNLHNNSQFSLISANTFVLGGSALPRQSKVREIFVQAERTTPKTYGKSNLASPRLHTKFPDEQGSSHARWRCAISFKDREKYNLLIVLEDGSEHTVAGIQFEPETVSNLPEHPPALKRMIERIESSRTIMEKNLAVGRGYLFVIGNARSGTTALARLLNASSEICIGIERYDKFNITANAFEKEAFFNPQSPGFKLRADLYNELEGKFDSARYIGDKRPGFTADWKNTLLNIPAIKILYIFRNIYDVSASYNQRASNAARGKDGAWPRDRNFIAAVEDWNFEIQQALLIAEHANLVCVKYEDIFRSEKRIHEMFESLAIDSNEPHLKATITNILSRGKSLEGKDRVLDAQARAYIDDHADFHSYRRLLELYQRQSTTTPRATTSPVAP